MAAIHIFILDDERNLSRKKKLLRFASVMEAGLFQESRTLRAE
jgi:hypothetical protein